MLRRVYWSCAIIHSSLYAVCFHSRTSFTKRRVKLSKNANGFKYKTILKYKSKKEPKFKNSVRITNDEKWELKIPWTKRVPRVSCCRSGIRTDIEQHITGHFGPWLLCVHFRIWWNKQWIGELWKQRASTQDYMSIYYMLDWPHLCDTYFKLFMRYSWEKWGVQCSLWVLLFWVCANIWV